MDYILYNEKILNIQDLSISILNRAFLYGDGIFETLVIQNGAIYYLHDHLERIMRGLQAFSILKPHFLDFTFLYKKISELASKNMIGRVCRVRINLWRKEGGLYTPTLNDCELLITMAPAYDQPLVKKNAFIFDGIKKSFSSISPFKTLNAAPYVLASLEKQKLQSDDMILLDTNNHISECTASNLFFVKGKKVFTPSLGCACIEGIIRKRILKVAMIQSIPVETGEYPVNDIYEAEFVFTCNVSGIIPLHRIENINFNTTNSIYDQIVELVKQDQIATAALI